ncbi:MAG: hypothetical protein BWY59_02471 [Verrucomicrobia bacterium ADurb.Bin345]|nr:MAG: hypothetical protein BWY59_02471 [Verrucomicrobia bacterium ADurb.Bin345]
MRHIGAHERNACRRGCTHEGASLSRAEKAPPEHGSVDHHSRPAQPGHQLLHLLLRHAGAARQFRPDPLPLAGVPRVWWRAAGRPRNRRVLPQPNVPRQQFVVRPKGRFLQPLLLAPPAAQRRGAGARAQRAGRRHPPRRPLADQRVAGAASRPEDPAQRPPAGGRHRRRTRTCSWTIPTKRGRSSAR